MCTEYISGINVKKTDAKFSVGKFHDFFARGLGSNLLCLVCK